MNIGIFGVGSFGEKHINVLKNNKKFNIIGFHDPDLKKSQKIEEKYQIKFYKDPENLIKKCDAIDIVSNTPTHYQIIKKGIKYNKHIFIEKPICCKKSEVVELLKKVKNYDPIIQVGHIERYNPAISKDFLHLKDIESITARRIGALNDRNRNTSIALDMMIHDIDLITTNINSKIMKIETISNNKTNGICNHIDCKITFNNGVVANLISTRKENIKSERKIIINCTEKTIEIDLLNRIRKEISKEEIKVFEGEKKINLLEKEFVDFYDCIRNNQQPLVGVETACQAVNIALEINNLITNN